MFDQAEHLLVKVYDHWLLSSVHADSLRDSSRVPPQRARGGGTRDESLRESAGEASCGVDLFPNQMVQKRSFIHEKSH